MECNHTVARYDGGKQHTYQVPAVDCPHCLRVEIEKMRAALDLSEEFNAQKDKEIERLLAEETDKARDARTAGCNEEWSC